jgi:hypothetical protein
MRYKRGDRVKIKSLKWYNENKDQHGKVACGYHVFTEEMSKFCGYTMIVCNRTNLGVMTMDGSASYWTDEMIEGLADVEPQDKMVSLDKAHKVFQEILVELCPELLGYGAMAVEWGNEFRKRLEK